MTQINGFYSPVRRLRIHIEEAAFCYEASNSQVSRITSYVVPSHVMGLLVCLISCWLNLQGKIKSDYCILGHLNIYVYIYIVKKTLIRLVMIPLFMLSHYTSWCVPVGVLNKQRSIQKWKIKEKSSVVKHCFTLHITEYIYSLLKWVNTGKTNTYSARKCHCSVKICKNHYFSCKIADCPGKWKNWN